jgi:hypothetical protein
MELIDTLRELEETLLRPSVRKDSHELDFLLADDFVEIGSSGRVFNKSQIIAELQIEAVLPAIRVSEFAVEMLTTEIALVTYRTTAHDADGRESLQSRRSSIWTYRDGRWRIRFHQGTRLP